MTQMRDQEYIAEELYETDYDELTLEQQAEVDSEIEFRYAMGWGSVRWGRE